MRDDRRYRWRIRHRGGRQAGPRNRDHLHLREDQDDLLSSGWKLKSLIRSIPITSFSPS